MKQKPNVVVMIPARSANEFLALVDRAREQEEMKQEIQVELTIEDEPSVYIRDQNRLFVGRNTVRAWFQAPRPTSKRYRRSHSSSVSS